MFFSGLKNQPNTNFELLAINFTLNDMRIVLTGGGTAGHVIPFEPIVGALRTQFLEEQTSLSPDVEPAKLEITFVGLVNENTKEFFAHLDVPVVHVPSGKLRRYASIQNIIDMVFRLPFGFVQALLKIFFIMPEIVISKGGYGSLPVVLAAAWYRIPILLHESDGTPGMANRFLMRFASAVTLGFSGALEKIPKKYSYKTIVTGTPVRSQLNLLSQAEAKKTFAINLEEKVLLVMGGSQGAKQINEALLQILPKLVLEYTIIHLTGDAHINTVTAVTQELLAQSSRKDNYKPFAHLTDTIGAALVSADGVISRSGSAVVELLALRKPMLLIPLASSASDHQRVNAHLLESEGVALVLDPNNLGINLFAQNIDRLMKDDPLRQKMIANMSRLDFPQSARTLATLAYKLARGLAPD